MTDDGSRRRSRLAAWADVDPARYPFDPGEAPALIEAVDPALWQPDARVWREAVSTVLADRYGPWAYHWRWAPDSWRQWNWVTSLPPPAEAPALAADLLLTWRQWLERIAERFDRYLPLLAAAEAAGPGGLAATWESAIADLMRTAVASAVDEDSWQGGCRMALRWLLTASGVPVERAEALVTDAVDERFDNWVPLTATDVVEVAERLTRSVLDLAGITPPAVTDRWPDTWPQNWPTWRATNTTGHPKT